MPARSHKFLMVAYPTRAQSNLQNEGAISCHSGGDKGSLLSALLRSSQDDGHLAFVPNPKALRA